MINPPVANIHAQKSGALFCFNIPTIETVGFSIAPRSAKDLSGSCFGRRPKDPKDIGFRITYPQGVQQVLLADTWVGCGVLTSREKILQFGVDPTHLQHNTRTFG